MKLRIIVQTISVEEAEGGNSFRVISDPYTNYIDLPDKVSPGDILDASQRGIANIVELMIEHGWIKI